MAPNRTIGILKRITRNPDFVWSVITANGSAVLNIVIQIVMVPLYIKSLGMAQFGVLMVLLAIYNYLAIGLGWASAGFQRVIGEHWANDDNESISNTYAAAKLVYLGYALLVCLLGGIAGLATPLGAQVFDDESRTIVLMLIAGYIVAAYDFNVDRITLTAIGRQAAGNALATCAQLVFVAIAVPGLILGHGFAAIFAGFFLGQVVARLAAAWLLRQRGLRWRLSNVAHAKPILHRTFGRMGIGYAIYALLLMGLLQGDVLLLGWLGGAVMVAEFVLVWKIADVAIQFLWRIPESMIPYLVKMDVDADIDAIKQNRRDLDRIMIVIGFVAGIGFALAGPTLVSLWVGPESAPDDRWAFILAGMAIFWLTIYRTSAIVAFALVKLRRLNMVLGLELLMKVLATLVLFEHFGYIAPIIAVSLFHGLGGALLYRRIGDHAMANPSSPT